MLVCVPGEGSEARCQACWLGTLRDGEEVAGQGTVCSVT